MRAAILELDIRAGYEVLYRPRDQHFASAGESRHPRSYRESHPPWRQSLRPSRRDRQTGPRVWYGEMEEGAV